MSSAAEIWKHWQPVYETVVDKTDSDGRILKKRSKIKEDYKKCKYCGITRTRKKRACCNHTNTCSEYNGPKFDPTTGNTFVTVTTKSLTNDKELLDSLVSYLLEETDDKGGWPELNETREWDNRLKIMLFILVIRPFLEKALDNNVCQQYIGKKAKKLIKNGKFWLKLNYGIRILTPIYMRLTQSQGNHSNLADLYTRFVDLIDQFQKRSNQNGLSSFDQQIALEVSQKLIKAKEDFLNSYLFPACTLIDPRHSAAKMTNDEITHGKEALKRYSIKMFPNWNINQCNSDYDGEEKENEKKEKETSDVMKELQTVQADWLSSGSSSDSDSEDSRDSENDNQNENNNDNNGNDSDGENNENKENNENDDNDENDGNNGDDVNMEDETNVWDHELLDVLEDMRDRKDKFSSAKWKSIGKHTSLKKIISLFQSLIKRNKNTKYERFGKLALCIITKPGGNAGVERVFNPVKFIHSWARNKLGRKMIDALVFIYVSEKCFEIWDTFQKHSI